MIAEEFSEGYYLSRFYVRPTEGKATVNTEDFHDIQYDIYDAGEHRNQVMCKLDGIYFVVHPRDRTAAGTIELPPSILDDSSIRNPPSHTEIMIVKPWVADYLSWSFPHTTSS